MIEQHLLRRMSDQQDKSSSSPGVGTIHSRGWETLWLSSFRCILVQWVVRRKPQLCNRSKDLKHRISRFPIMTLVLYLCVNIMLAYQEVENPSATCINLFGCKVTIKLNFYSQKEERQHPDLPDMRGRSCLTEPRRSRRVFFRHCYLTWQSIFGAVNKTSSLDLATGRASASSRQKGPIENPLK